MNKKTKIINPQLPKPWLLIAVYESMFDKYITAKKQLWYATQGAKNRNLPLTLTVKARINRMKERMLEISKTLRDADQQIHNYIVSHNKPHHLKQAS